MKKTTRKRRNFTVKDLETMTYRFTSTDDTITQIAKDLKRDANTVGQKIKSLKLKRGKTTSKPRVTLGGYNVFTISPTGAESLTNALTEAAALHLVNATLAEGGTARLMQDVPVKFTVALQ